MKRLTTYKAGLIKSPWSKKFMWQLEKDTDRLSPSIYEFHEIRASNKREATGELNKWYGSKYKGKGIRKKPFNWGEGWW